MTIILFFYFECNVEWIKQEKLDFGCALGVGILISIFIPPWMGAVAVIGGLQYRRMKGGRPLFFVPREKTEEEKLAEAKAAEEKLAKKEAEEKKKEEEEEIVEEKKAPVPVEDKTIELKDGVIVVWQVSRKSRDDGKDDQKVSDPPKEYICVQNRAMSLTKNLAHAAQFKVKFEDSEEESKGLDMNCMGFQECLSKEFVFSSVPGQEMFHGIYGHSRLHCRYGTLGPGERFTVQPAENGSFRVQHVASGNYWGAQPQTPQTPDTELHMVKSRMAISFIPLDGKSIAKKGN